MANLQSRLKRRLQAGLPAPPKKQGSAGEFVRGCDEGATIRRFEGAVTAVGSDDEVGFGPRTVERPRAFHGANDIVTALHDDSGDMADARDVAQQLVVGFEEGMVEEVVDLNAREGESE